MLYDDHDGLPIETSTADHDQQNTHTLAMLITHSIAVVTRRMPSIPPVCLSARQWLHLSSTQLEDTQIIIGQCQCNDDGGTSEQID